MTGAEFDGVDIDLLADYIGGALADTPDEAAVAALVADDPAWRAAFESLGGGMALVGAELGRLAPEPMPDELAARLDAMFRTAGSAAPADPEPIADTSPIAGALAAPPVPHLALVRGDDPPEEGAGRRPERRVGPRRSRRWRWAAPIAVAAGVVAFAGFGLDRVANRGTGGAADSAAGLAAESAADALVPSASSDVHVLTTGTDYTHATLAAPPPQPMTAPELGSATSKSGFPQQASGTDPALGRLAGRAALQSCLAAIQRDHGGGTITVQSVDYARFDGAPAVVVRFAADDGQWAWASGPACGTPTGDSDMLDRVPVG